MSEPPSPAEPTDEDTWPWQCLRCEATVFHDVELCRDCEVTRVLADGTDQPEAAAGFVEWTRHQSVAEFSLKVTAMAGVEVSLTALWLHLFLARSVDLVGVVPIP